MLINILIIGTARKLSCGLCFVVVSYLLLAAPSPLNAAPVVGFIPGNIIDDSVFTDKSTMTVTQIQGFLNNKVASCDTYGLQPSEYGGGTRAQWATARGYPPPYTCLKDYTENGQSAAQIIFNVSQNYNINPQVLIVLLQKEQGLINDSWPLSIQYRSATGYGCPDNAPCESQYFGLTNQLTWSGKMFKAIMTASPAWYTPYILGNNNIQWSPDASCGGSQVNIINRATQALYNYTPYQPNQSALNAGYGNGDSCSSYGNRNFYLYFKDWFGSTVGPQYSFQVDSSQIYIDELLTEMAPKLGDKYILQPNQTYYASVQLFNNGRSKWNSQTNLGTSRPTDRTSNFYSTSWLSKTRLVGVGTATDISINQTANVTFQLKSPSESRVYNEHYDLVQEGLLWFGKGFSFQVQVSAPSYAPSSEGESGLEGGEKLEQSGYLVSSDGYSVLRINQFGGAELYVNFQKVWETVGAGEGSYMTMQPDGNLVLYSSTGRPYWSSGTAGENGSNVYLQPDGNLVIYRRDGQSTWQSNTSLGLSHDLFPTSEIYSHGIMFKDQAIYSYDRKYSLNFQKDGNLVLYNRPTGKPLWSSNTQNLSASVFSVQPDGNMVVYNTSGKALWNSRSAGKGLSRLAVQNDGNLVLYNTSPAHSWASDTAAR